MHIGMIGLGRMGASLVERLAKADHHCVVYDIDYEQVKKSVNKNVEGVHSLEELVKQLPQPRAIWIMLPAGVVDKTIKQLAGQMDAGDIIIDGGNSYYRDDFARAKALNKKGIHYVDCGTSGGVFGLTRGYCLMIGGEDEVINYLDPIFKTIASGVKTAQRTSGKKGKPNSAEQGYWHCGPVGAGHFVKMVHNGIEYGLMAAYAEGFNILRNANIGKSSSKKKVSRQIDAETTPLRNAAYYQYELNLPEIAEVWRRGSVISSWLLDLTAASLLNNPDLDNYTGRVSDSGEGRWTIEAAIDESVPAPILSAALYERFSSRGEADFSHRILSAMRKQFGGHEEKNKEAQHNE